MTPLERQQRRQRQTGRSSLAEKAAREQREALLAEVEAERDIARQFADNAERLLEEAIKRNAAAELIEERAAELKARQAELVDAAERDREFAAALRARAEQDKVDAKRTLEEAGARAKAMDIKARAALAIARRDQDRWMKGLQTFES